MSGASQAITLQYILLSNENGINLKMDSVSRTAAMDWSKQNVVSPSSSGTSNAHHTLVDRVAQSFSGKILIFYLLKFYNGNVQFLLLRLLLHQLRLPLNGSIWLF